MIPERTEGWCSDCRKWHPALIRSEDSSVFFDMDCPLEKHSTLISSDKNLFLLFRERSGYQPVSSGTDYTWSHRLEIIRSCNAACPVCYVSATKEPGTVLAIENVSEITRILKKEKRKLLTLSGGEPTLADNLPEMIKAVRKAGMKVSLLSNGILLNDRKSVQRLVSSGLNYLFLQFDTLLPSVHSRLRGSASTVEMKKNALNCLQESGMKFGINTVVVRDNLKELSSLLNTFRCFSPQLNMVCLLIGNGSTGRFSLPEEQIVTREDAVHSLIEGQLFPGIETGDFWPLPVYRPLGLNVHPDCAVLLPLAVSDGDWLPLKDVLDMEKLYRLLKAVPGPVNLFRGDSLFLYYAFQCCRPGKKRLLFRLMKGYRSGKGKHCLFFVVIEQFLGRYYQDRRRLERCSTMQVYRDGSLTSLCQANAPDFRKDALKNSLL